MIIEFQDSIRFGGLQGQGPTVRPMPLSDRQSGKQALRGGAAAEISGVLGDRPRSPPRRENGRKELNSIELASLEGVYARSLPTDCVKIRGWMIIDEGHLWGRRISSPLTTMTLEVTGQ